jgi:hypothetical protein
VTIIHLRICRSTASILLSLTEGRVIRELAQRAQATASELAADVAVRAVHEAV